MNAAPDKPKSRRRWFQFSLGSLFLLVVVLSVPLAWLAYERNKVRKREAAIAAIERLNGNVHFDDSQPFRPAWMGPLLGDNSTSEVAIVELQFSDSLTDDDMANVAGFTRLRDLNLSHSRVSDAALTNLEWISLDDTQVSDAGLVQLAALPKLEWLELKNTRVTAQGFKKLQTALPNVRTGRLP